MKGGAVNDNTENHQEVCYHLQVQKFLLGGKGSFNS